MCGILVLNWPDDIINLSTLHKIFKKTFSFKKSFSLKKQACTELILCLFKYTNKKNPRYS